MVVDSVAWSESCWAGRMVVSRVHVMVVLSVAVKADLQDHKDGEMLGLK